jgi:hypothetical protein
MGHLLQVAYNISKPTGSIESTILKVICSVVGKSNNSTDDNAQRYTLISLYVRWAYNASKNIPNKIGRSEPFEAEARLNNI